MSRFRLVVSDVDGTLVTSDKRLTERAAAAVRRLHQNHIAFSLCSSRPPFGVRMLMEPLGLDLPFGAYNGGAIVAPDLTVIEQRLVPPDAVREAVDVFRDHGLDPWLFTGGEWRTTNPAGPHVAHETRTVDLPPRIVPRFTDADFAAVGKVVGASDDHGKVARLVALLGEKLAGRATVARSQPYYCDVIPPGVDKGRVIEFLAGRLGVARGEILVLGDMDNDLQMFAKSGFAVAMGNAAESVKHAAQAVTAANDEDGFAAAIERFVLAD